MQEAEKDSSIRLCLLDYSIAVENPLLAIQKLGEAIIPVTDPAYFGESSRLAFQAFMLGHYVVYNRQFPEAADVMGYADVQELRDKLKTGARANSSQ